MKRYAEQMKRSLSQLLDDQGVSVVEIILILVGIYTLKEKEYSVFVVVSLHVKEGED